MENVKNNGYAICVVNEEKNMVLTKEIKSLHGITNEYLNQGLIDIGNEYFFEIEKIKEVPKDSIFFVFFLMKGEKDYWTRELNIYYEINDVVIMEENYKETWLNQIKEEIKIYKEVDYTEIEKWESFYKEEIDVKELL